MKERITLFILVFGLGIFIYIFQSYFNTIFALAFLCTLMTFYALFSSLAYQYKKRKLKKYPQVVNNDYKPFVTVMIPAHNEESVIGVTVENILGMTYDKFEVIVIDNGSEEEETKNLFKEYKKHKCHM